MAVTNLTEIKEKPLTVVCLYFKLFDFKNKISNVKNSRRVFNIIVGLLKPSLKEG